VNDQTHGFIYHITFIPRAVLWSNPEVRSNLASQDKRLTDMMNVVPLDQLLPYSSRCVAVAFAYNRVFEAVKKVCVYPIETERG
jgi:hypothetical protein